MEEFVSVVSTDTMFYAFLLFISFLAIFQRSVVERCRRIESIVALRVIFGALLACAVFLPETAGANLSRKSIKQITQIIHRGILYLQYSFDRYYAIVITRTP